MAEKVTTMVLKVDHLDCNKCKKKVKNLLCKNREIRDQIYDEKANTVTITVVCCSPELFRDKLCRKGRGTIKSIDIKEPVKPPPKPPVVPKPDPPVVPPVHLALYPSYGVCCVLCYEGRPCYCRMQPMPTPPCNCGCGGRCYTHYFIEENPSAPCTIM